MNKKIFMTFLLISFLLLVTSYCFAANGAMNNAKSAVMSAGNSVGNVVGGAANAVADGARSLTDGAARTGNDAASATRNVGDDNTAANDATIGTLDTGDNDYNATRTVTGTMNLFGMSTSAWTWIILAIAGLAIVGLVWYYGAQYEHRNYNND